MCGNGVPKMEERWRADHQHDQCLVFMSEWGYCLDSVSRHPSAQIPVNPRWD